jgi:hypothetical protein
MPRGSSNQHVSLLDDPRYDGLDTLAATTTYTTTTTTSRFKDLNLVYTLHKRSLESGFAYDQYNQFIGYQRII